jgi:glycosyltransferase involved in cell wall biosynthesis
MPNARMLGVLLCYNDGDILEDSLKTLLASNHHVIAWNHGSTDNTSQILRTFKSELVEITDVPRSVDFYDLYPLMSKHLMAEYTRRYDWISWPDQDEFLEGPTRETSYPEWVRKVLESRHSWVDFNDMVYCFTEKDDTSIQSLSRIRHYSLARLGPRKVRAWRASATNIRWFNHNPAQGTRYPVRFNLRHYPFRNEKQMWRRIHVDREGIQRGPINFHYENMKSTLATFRVRPEDFHYDDGGPLNMSIRFDWSGIYGKGPQMPPEVVQSYFLGSMKWEVASTVRDALTNLPPSAVAEAGAARLQRWLGNLQEKAAECVVVVLGKDHAAIVTTQSDQALDGNAQAGQERTGIKTAETRLGSMRVVIVADAVQRRVLVTVLNKPHSSQYPLLALVPSCGGDASRVRRIADDGLEFSDLRAVFYYLSCEE